MAHGHPRYAKTCTLPGPHMAAAGAALKSVILIPNGDLVPAMVQEATGQCHPLTVPFSW